MQITSCGEIHTDALMEITTSCHSIPILELTSIGALLVSVKMMSWTPNTKYLRQILPWSHSETW